MFRRNRKWLGGAVAAVILAMFMGAAPAPAASSSYSYPLYPYANDSSKVMTYKIMLDRGDGSPVKSVDDVLQYIKEVDTLTRGIPKIAILVGWQEGGHDWQYPNWGPVNSKLKRPQDASATASLLYLMNQAATLYHTNTTVHVNLVDSYQDSPAWGTYVANNWIDKNADGSLVTLGVWNNRQSYAVNQAKEWEDGRLQQLLDGLITLLPPIKTTKMIYFDATDHYAASPGTGYTSTDELNAIKSGFGYLKTKYDVDAVNEALDPEFYGFQTTGWLGYSFHNTDPMQVPSYVQANSLWQPDTLDEVFGGGVKLEDDVFHADTYNVLGLFTHSVLPYQYMNMYLRDSYNATASNLTMSDGVSSYIDSSGKHIITQNGNYVEIDNDVFIPEVWKPSREIMSYDDSDTARTWTFPSNWNNVTSADVYYDTKTGPVLKQAGVNISSHTITLGGDNYGDIKAKWRGPNGNQTYYLYDDGTGKVAYGSTMTGDAYKWSLESSNGYTQIKNKLTGNYMSIEHLQSYVESIPVNPGWASKDWIISDTGDGYKRIQSGWASHPDYVNIEDLTGYAEHSATININDYSVEWTFEGFNPSNGVIVVPAGTNVNDASTDYGTIRSKWRGPANNQTYYLYDDGTGKVGYGTTPSGDAYQWERINVNGYTQIMNKLTGNYMSIEHSLGYVESIPANPGWASINWSITDAGDGYQTIQNGWANHPDYLNIEHLTGYAEHSPTIAAGAYSAEWYFDGGYPSSGTAVFSGTDTTTQGNWKSAYGGAGYGIVGDSSQQPSYGSFSYKLGTDATWAASTTDPRALLKASSTTDRVAARRYANLHETIDVNVGATPRDVALYLMEWGSGDYQESVDVIDSDSGRILNTQIVSNFNNGVYLKYSVTGRVQFRVTKFYFDGYNNPGGVPEFSGVFFN